MTDTLTLPELTQTLRRQGVRLHVHNGRLKVKGPRHALTPALRQAIQANRTALLRTTMRHHYAPAT